MATYKMDDGTVAKSENATARYGEHQDWNGSNHIGRSSCSQWHDQMLYRSKNGHYWLEHSSRVQGERDWAEWLSPEQAAAWLLHNDYEIPDELKEAANRVEE